MIFSERVDNFFLRYLTECLVSFCVCMFSLCLHLFSLSHLCYPKAKEAFTLNRKYQIPCDNWKFRESPKSFGFSLWILLMQFRNSHSWTIIKKPHFCADWPVSSLLLTQPLKFIFSESYVYRSLTSVQTNTHIHAQVLAREALLCKPWALPLSVLLSPQATRNKQSHFFLSASFFSLSLSCPLFSLLFHPSLSPSPVSTSPSFPSLSFHLLRLFLFIAFYCAYPLHRRGEWISKLILDSCSGWWATLRIWIGNTAADLG